MYLAHPLCVTVCQIVVDRYDMNALACKCIEICGTGGNKGLTFTGSHLGDPALMKYYSTDKLYPEMLKSYSSLGSFSNDRKCFGKYVVQGLSLFKTLLEPGSLGLEFFIRKCLHFRS